MEPSNRHAEQHWLQLTKFDDLWQVSRGVVDDNAIKNCNGTDSYASRLGCMEQKYYLAAGTKATGRQRAIRPCCK